ncbi:MAG TPA: TonB family protein [Terracidiphilus sp.]
MSVATIPELARVSIAGRSDRGKVREENQAVVHHAGTKFGDLLVVANGIGDAGGGSQAARMAVDTISSRLEGMLAFFPLEIALEEAVRQANTELTAASAVPECPYSCTGVAVILALLRRRPDGAHVTIGHVGDSRAYLLHKRKLALLSSESTGASELFDGKGKAAHDGEEHPERDPLRDQATLTPYLGQGLNIKVATCEIQLEAGDTLLLCSDGLWRSVPEQEMERVLADRTHNVEEACRALLDLALDAGGPDNIAMEIARVNENGASPTLAAQTVRNQSAEVPEVAVGLPQMVMTDGAPVIEWRAPEGFTYGTALNDTQLNAIASAPGTFLYNPGQGAMLSTGEHTLSVVFMPSSESGCRPAQASVPLSVAKATPSIVWAAPDAINNATPLGPAQLNARASVPGSFVYSPAAGEMPGTGRHTLSVTFTPADGVNYEPVQASVPLTVIEPMEATITWPSPAAIAYGTVLGDEQLNARASVPGSFLYVPARGNVLPPGKHELSVIFTPEDRVEYTEARATVTLIVDEVPMVAPVSTKEPTPLDSGAGAEPVAERIKESDELSGSFANTPEADDAANEVSTKMRLKDDAEESRSEPETAEEAQAEIPLFRGFQSYSEAEGGQKSASRWLTIASVVIAIPMLCVLIFLVDKAHSGAPFIAKLVNHPAPTAGDTPGQPDTQDPSHRVKITVDQPSAGVAGQPASNGQPGNNGQADKPAQVQTETTYDQPAGPAEGPSESKKQAAENVPSTAGSGRGDAGGPGANAGATRAGTQPTDREGAPGLATVSAEAAAGRLMESRMPIYPPGAKEAGVSGTVELEATISKDGTVKDLRAVSGPEQLRQAAIQSVRTWRYRPFVMNNEPAEVQTTINVVFSPNE